MSTPTTHDFGAGPVPAHQHPNGGGWVADTAHVDDTAYVGSARVFDSARVYDSARVSGTARVYGSARVYDSRHVLTLPQLGNESGTLWRTADGHQLQAGCKLTTIEDASEALRHPEEVWPGETLERWERFVLQWRAALILCALRVDEWAS